MKTDGDPLSQRLRVWTRVPGVGSDLSKSNPKSEVLGALRLRTFSDEFNGFAGVSSEGKAILF
jgi:hypothetical protein